MVSAADKPAEADLLCEKNIIPCLISSIKAKLKEKKLISRDIVFFPPQIYA
jgi:hypothetical protein